MVAGLMVLGQALPALAADAEALREKIAGGIAFYNARAHLKGQDLYGYSGLRVEPRGEAFRVSLSDFSVLLDVAEMTRLGIAAGSEDPVAKLGFGQQPVPENHQHQRPDHQHWNAFDYRLA